MNRLLFSKVAAPLRQKGKQWTTQNINSLRFNSTEAVLNNTESSNVTINTFNRTLAFQFKRDQDPKRILNNVMKIVKDIKKHNLRFDRGTYSAILAAYSRNRDSNSILRTLEEMKQNGFEPTIDNYNLALEGFASAGNVKQQLALKEEMLSKGFEFNASSQYQLLRGMCKAKKLDNALALLKEMKQVNFNAYATVINACVEVSRSDIAFDMLKQAEQLTNIDTQPRIYMDVLRVAAFNDDLEIIEYCWEKAIKSYSMRPDEGTLLNCLRVASKMGKPELGTDIIRQLSVHGYPYKEHYFTPLMEAFIVNGDLKSAFNVLDIMRISGVTPTMRTTLPIRKHLKMDVEAIDNAYYILEELKKENKNIDVTAFNVIVQACAEAKDLDRTVATYREAANLGVTPNVDTYNAVLDVCIKNRMKGMGNAVIEEMKKAQVSPNLDTYTKMIQLACTQKNYEDAFTYLEEMKSYDIVPPETCYIHLAQKLSYAKDPRFRMVLDEMETFGYKLTPKIIQLTKSNN